MQIVLIYVGLPILISAYKMSFPSTQMQKKEIFERIYEGNASKESQFPFMVLVLGISNTGMQRCSGSIIAKSEVLTAAHCVYLHGLQVMLVLAGKANLNKYMNIRNNIIRNWAEPMPKELLDGVQERLVAQIFIHPRFRYRPEFAEHDIAVLRITNPFLLLRNVQIGVLAKEPIESGTNCTILGFGQVNKSFSINSQLFYANEVTVHVVPSDCIYRRYGHFLCVKNSKSGICNGDSGSPLVCNKKIYGVASHVIYSNEDGTELDVACGTHGEQYYIDLWFEAQFIRIVLESPSISPSSTHSHISTALFLVAILKPIC